jgi:putative transcriptional regulator
MTKIVHHPDIATLIGFSSGALGEALSLVVACHLDVCGACRGEVRRMNRIGGAIMEAATVEPLSAGTRIEALTAGHMDTVEQAATAVAGLPLPLARILGRPLADVAWKMLVPGVKHYPLPLSARAAGYLTLLKVSPGRSVPDHGHGGTELTLVLEGSYRDEHGIYRVGDLEDMDGDAEHRPVVEGEEPCICLIASESKAMFKGWAGRLIQPLTGM